MPLLYKLARCSTRVRLPDIPECESAEDTNRELDTSGNGTPACAEASVFGQSPARVLAGQMPEDEAICCPAKQTFSPTIRGKFAKVPGSEILPIIPSGCRHGLPANMPDNQMMTRDRPEMVPEPSNAASRASWAEGAPEAIAEVVKKLMAAQQQLEARYSSGGRLTQDSSNRDVLERERQDFPANAGGKINLLPAGGKPDRQKWLKIGEAPSPRPSNITKMDDRHWLAASAPSSSSITQPAMPSNGTIQEPTARPAADLVSKDKPPGRTATAAAKSSDEAKLLWATGECSDSDLMKQKLLVEALYADSRASATHSESEANSSEQFASSMQPPSTSSTAATSRPMPGSQQKEKTSTDADAGQRTRLGMSPHDHDPLAAMLRGLDRRRQRDAAAFARRQQRIDEMREAEKYLPEREAQACANAEALLW